MRTRRRRDYQCFSIFVDDQAKALKFYPAVKPFRDALIADGIPFTSFGVDDVQKEYERLVALGVEFT